MDLQILITNLTNPTLLYFFLGITAIIVKSDLEIPPTSMRFISLYLLFAIGFKGGQELTHSPIDSEILLSLLFAILLAFFIPLFTFFILRWKFSISDSAAVAAAYGSVSAVTFVACINFLESQSIPFGGHMVAVMALMESPAIIMGFILLMKFDSESSADRSLGYIFKHSITNGSVLMILGSLVIGLVSDSEAAAGIEPFTNDIFKGFLAIYLLDMGMLTARRFKAFTKYGIFAFAFSILIPMANGIAVSFASFLITDSVGNRLIFAILAASASYIAVPAAMRIAAPKADPGLYIPMALGVTFPFNITLGMPLYYYFITL